MDYAYPKPPEAVDVEPRLSNKSKRWRRIGAAGVATLLSAGVVGVASAESDNNPKPAVISTATKELELSRQATQSINKGRMEAEWIKHVHDQTIKDGMAFAISLFNFVAKVNESHNSYVPSVNNSSSYVTGTSYNGNVDAFLACTRAHESDTAGGYQAISPDGVYHGAYQFDQSTWDSTAANNGRPDLVGQDPASVTPVDQDQMATDLYEERGNQPWGGRC